MLLLLLLLSYAQAHDPLVNITTNCTEGINYMVPFKDGIVLDPCNDGACWTLCDHAEWHDWDSIPISKDHLKEEQYDCISSACANFFYGHVNLQVLEECARYKCLVSTTQISSGRECSKLLLRGSSLYNLLEEHKRTTDRFAKQNRSMVEYGKNNFMFRVNSILDEEHSSIWNLELSVHDMNTVLEVKDPVSERNMIEKILTALKQSIDAAHTAVNQITNATLITNAIQQRLFLIESDTSISSELASALKKIKEYLDQVRLDVIHSYVYNSSACVPIDVLVDAIEADCNMCLHGACNLDIDTISFHCDCAPGWQGDYCNAPITSCLESPCLNTGTCMDEYETFRCECPSEWTGRYCEQLIDTTQRCLSGACQNSALCTNTTANYICDCLFGWSGTNCQYSIRECSALNPCEHEGLCQFNGTRIECDCPTEPVYKQPFFKGHTCAVEQYECDYLKTEYMEQSLIHGEPCSGHGLCQLSPLIEGFECICDPAWRGERCQLRATSCSNLGIVCDYGNCNHCESHLDCVCSCDDGYTGQECEVEINPCAPNPCMANTPCIQDHFDFYCDCSAIPGHFGGKKCEKQVSCPEACGYDSAIVCNDMVEDIKCGCDSNFVGNRCEKNIQTCDEYSCLNDGLCVQGDGGFCNCLNGYTGDRCQHEPAFCENNPCGTYGTCSALLNSYNCICDPGFNGEQCNHDINECDPNPCKNFGTCIDKINAYECACPIDYHGDHCEILNTPCDTVVCANHGVCLDTRLSNWTETDFECACPTRTCHRLNLGKWEGDYGENDTVLQSYWLMVVGVAVGLFLSSIFAMFYCQNKQSVHEQSVHEQSMRKKRNLVECTQIYKQ